MKKMLLSIIVGAALLAGCGQVVTPPAPPKEPQDHCIADGCMLPTTSTTFEVVCQSIDCTEEVK